jgi:hypothetical protein
MISWMMLPWHAQTLNKFTDECKVAQVIRNNAPTSGVYILPNMYAYTDSTSQQEMVKGSSMMDKGPVVFASVMRDGMGKMTARPFVISLILQIIGAGIVTWMLMKTKGLSYRQQVGFVTLFGVAVAILGILPQWNWWGFSIGYTLSCMIDLVIGWFLAGLAIAKLCKR